MLRHGDITVIVYYFH